MRMQKGMSCISRRTPALAPLCRRNAQHRRGCAAAGCTRTRHPKGNRRSAAPKVPLPHAFQTRAAVGGHAVDGAAATVAACRHALHARVQYGTKGRASRLTQISLTRRPVPYLRGGLSRHTPRPLSRGWAAGGRRLLQSGVAGRVLVCMRRGCRLRQCRRDCSPQKRCRAGGRPLLERPPARPLLLSTAAASHSHPPRPPVPAQRFSTVVIGCVACGLPLLLRR